MLHCSFLCVRSVSNQTTQPRETRIFLLVGSHIGDFLGPQLLALLPLRFQDVWLQVEIVLSMDARDQHLNSPEERRDCSRKLGPCDIPV